MPSALRCARLGGGRSRVRTLYRNARYIGKRAYKGEVVADAEWEPILDSGTFYAVNAVLDDPKRRQAPGKRDTSFREPKTLLASLAVCGKCGGPVRASVQGKNHTPAYTCRTGGCFSMTRANAEEVVVAEVFAWAEGVETLTSEAREAMGEVLALRAEVDKVEERRRQIGEAIGAGQLDIVVATAELVANESPAAWWADLTIAKRREVVDTLMEVRLHPARPERRRFDESLVEIIPK